MLKRSPSVDLEMSPWRTKTWTPIRFHAWGCPSYSCQRGYDLRRLPGRLCEGFRPWDQNLDSNNHSARSESTMSSLSFMSHVWYKGVDLLSMSMLNSELFTCSANGWIKISNCAHNIIWIPPPFRRVLWRPQDTCIISCNGYHKSSFEGCVYGED